MRKLLIGLFFVLLLSGSAFAAETSVRSMQTDCTVSKDGSCTVVITAEVNFPASEQEFVIPIAAGASDISTGGLSFRKVRSGDYQLLHLQNEAGFSGLQKFTVSYHLANAATDNGDTQEFSVTLLYPAWSCQINRYRFSVSFPEPFDALPVLRSGYYSDLIDNYLNVQIQDTVIRAELNEKQTLQDHESMQLSLTLPQGYFDLRFLAGRLSFISLLLFLLLFAVSALYWTVFLRRRPIFARRQAMPPVGCNAGAVPYTLTGKNADLALMIVQWATDGYLTIHRTRKGRVLLEKLIDMDNERKSWEVELFRTLFRKRDVCDVQGETYRTTRKLAAVLTEKFYKPSLFADSAGGAGKLRFLGFLAGVAYSLRCFDILVPPQSWRWYVILPLAVLGGASCLLVQRAGGCMLRRHTLRTLLLVLLGAGFLLAAGSLGGGMALLVLCLLLQLFIGVSLRFGGKRTEAGTVHVAELLGFRRYLRMTPPEELRKNLTADTQYYYRVLPYAEALRVARLFTGAFAECRLEPCDWLRWEGKELKYGGQFYARFLRLMAALRGEGSTQTAKRRK